MNEPEGNREAGKDENEVLIRSLSKAERHDDNQDAHSTISEATETTSFYAYQEVCLATGEDAKGKESSSPGCEEIVKAGVEEVIGVQV